MRVMARVLPVDDPNAIEEAAALLRRGDVVAVPTETVYGLAADATNPQAVAKIFEVKARPAHDPLIVHVADTEAALALWENPPALARRLAQAFWPGPLTMVHPARPGAVAPAVTAGLGTLAVRVSAHPGFLSLLRACGLPLAAPSANPVGQTSPTTAAHVASALGDRIPLILDGGPCRVGLESTVISLEPELVVLRLGGVPKESLEEVLGRPLASRISSSQPTSPGQLSRHYAPHTPLYLMPSPDALPPPTRREKAALICPLASQLSPRAASGFAEIRVLSPKNRLEEAAQNLYGTLLALDKRGFEAIFALKAPEVGLGRAINDRLTRASEK